MTTTQTQGKPAFIAGSLTEKVFNAYMQGLDYKEIASQIINSGDASKDKQYARQYCWSFKKKGFIPTGSITSPTSSEQAKSSSAQTQVQTSSKDATQVVAPTIQQPKGESKVITTSPLTPLAQKALENEEKESAEVVIKVTKKPSASAQESLLAYVPRKSSYIPRVMDIKKGTTDVGILKIAYNATPKDNVKIVGETGSGKTALVRKFCADEQLPYYRVNFSAGTTQDQLIGHMIPNKNKTGADQTDLVWQDGVVTTFARYGGVIVLDELNACPPEINTFLHPLLDDERKLTLLDNDGEVIEAHKNFFVVSTMNPSDYQGVEDLSYALNSRHAVKLELNCSPEIEKKLNLDKHILELAERLRLMKQEGKLESPISTRNLIAYTRHKVSYGEALAFEFFINGFQPAEREGIKKAWDMLSSRGKKGFEDNIDGE